MPWFHCLPKVSNHQDILPVIVLFSTKKKMLRCALIKGQSKAAWARSQHSALCTKCINARVACWHTAF